MDFRINVNKKMLYKLFIGLVLLEIIFVIAYFAVVAIPNNKLYTLFNLDGESTIPSWFSSMQFFLIGLIFWIKSLQLINFPPISTFFYKFAGTGFIYLSADEASQFHEKIGNFLRGIDNVTTSIPHFEGGHGHGYWILPYILIGLIFVFIFYKSIINLFKYYKISTIIMVSGFFITILGGVGFEIIGYEFSDANKFLPNILEVAAEEFFEMLGSSVVLYGVSLILTDDNKSLSY